MSGFFVIIVLRDPSFVCWLIGRRKFPRRVFLKLFAKKKLGIGASEVESDGGGGSGANRISVAIPVGDPLKCSEVEVSVAKLDSTLKERKSHREYSLSRSHHHKKHKNSVKVVILEDSDKVYLDISLFKKVDPVACDGDSVEKVTGKGKETFGTDVAVVEASKPARFGVIGVCKEYATKIVAELDKLDTGLINCEASELEKLQEEFAELKKVKIGLDAQLAEMTHDCETNSSKISSLLST
ncbi:uncharacterized protein LOC141721477 [Apium graveolens]|uniref:uncharacterized protein LOC141721477 n=1 Tax=Apium graveolens TaxID=4045 RepID=UPI003D7B1A41